MHSVSVGDKRGRDDSFVVWWEWERGVRGYTRDGVGIF